MNSMDKIKNIIEALGKHEDESSVDVLTEFGTNSPDDEIREYTAQALIRKNTPKALEVVLVSRGKGINDLSARVAMSAINELLSLKDKTEAIKILDNSIETSEDEEIKNTARSVRALMTFSV
ncbi:HEAT repeat domain-containing protein [bacterium]|nr:HEAT repeat domain-containing protein [bacterium]